jgi:transposase-like protein
MPRRKIMLNAKVAAMRESLRLMNVEDIARKHKLSKPALYKWYHEVLEALPDILADERPGRKPKPKSKADAAPPF